VTGRRRLVAVGITWMLGPGQCVIVKQIAAGAIGYTH
jgi:hypothetical protein